MRIEHSVTTLSWIPSEAVEGMQRGIVDEQMRQRTLLEGLDRGQKEQLGMLGGLLASDSKRAKQDALHDKQLAEHDRQLTLRSMLIVMGAAIGSGIAQTLWNVLQKAHQ